jgi:hypothetical protein
MPAFTQADVEYLVAARKFICRTVEDNTTVYPLPYEMRLTFDIRKRDYPQQDIGLRFRALREPHSVISKWGIALLWHGKRIRGIDYKLREDIIDGGLIIGHLRHWHEHFWTDKNQDKNIIDVNSLVKNEDMRALVELCMARWNIEGYSEQGILEGM